jgi:DNA-binding transcriptional LysR family regulator
LQLSVDEIPVFYYASAPMQTETLRVFCDVVETGSFTVAAKRHGVTQSAVTQMFRGLERRFKSRFAVRKPKGFRLTPEGGLFYAICRKVLRLEAELFRRLQQTREAAPGIIRLAACYTAGLHQLPPVLDRFRRDYPAIDVRDSYHQIGEVHELVLDHRADLGFLCYLRSRGGLTVDLLGRDRMMAILPPQHPLAGRRSVTARELEGEMFAGWDALHASPFLRGLPGRQRRLFRPRHKFDEVETVKGLVEGGDYIAILPESAVHAEVASQRLAAVPFTDAGCTEPLGVIYRGNKILTPAMTTFIHFLKQPAAVAN